MKKIIFIFLVLGIFLTSAIAEETPKQIILKEGKNNITINFEFNPLYVETLVGLYPEIEAVSYEERTFYGYEKKGYVNVLGGVGKNFVILQNQSYEIIVNKNITIVLK